MRKQEGPGHLENPEKKIHKIFFHISFFFFFYLSVFIFKLPNLESVCISCFAEELFIL